MAFEKLRIMVKRGRTIMQEEGFRAFVRRAALFLKNSFSFHYTNYYVYENKLNWTQFETRTQDISLRVLSTPENFDELVAEGFSLSPWDINSLKNKTLKKAMPFCVFVGQHLAHVTWVALSEQAKNDVDPFPIKINWQSEAWSGSSRTAEKYQRMGLFSYVYAGIFRFLKERGRVTDKFTVEKNNTASLHAVKKWGSEVIAEGWCLKVFLWQFWKYKPLRTSEKNIM